MQVPHEVKYQRAVKDSPNNEKWTRCKYPKWEVVLGVPYRVNITCLIHDTRLCQIDVKMTNITKTVHNTVAQSKTFKL